MRKIKLAGPVVKWAGGKRQLLEQITPLLPKRKTMYCEPFVGGGALLFHIQPAKAVINDLNADLMTVYRVIRDDADALVAELGRHENTLEHFLYLRNLDRDRDRYCRLTDVERAARILYLNKTCYNGLYRVNSSGEFNTPFGKYANPNIVNEPVLRAVSRFLRNRPVELCNEDFAAVLERLPKGAFAYLDPPYDPVSGTANFTGYNKGGFGRDEQLRLKACCDDLTRRGIRFLLSNSATDFIRELYRDRRYNIRTVEANRPVNSAPDRRGAVEEVLIRNYGTE